MVIRERTWLEYSGGSITLKPYQVVRPLIKQRVSQYSKVRLLPTKSVLASAEISLQW
jgi:hypothetical protein